MGAIAAALSRMHSLESLDMRYHQAPRGWREGDPEYLADSQPFEPFRVQRSLFTPRIDFSSGCPSHSAIPGQVERHDRCGRDGSS
jgi:hypothetical protein